MEMPERIRAFIGTAQEALQKHSRHALPPEYRRILYKDMEDLGEIGHELLSAISIRTAREVLPYIAIEDPVDRRAEELIQAAEAVTRGSMHVAIARGLADRMEDFLDSADVQVSMIPERLYFSYLSAWHALITVLERHNRFLYVDIEANCEDSDIDVDSLDVAGLVAIAVAGSLYDPASDGSARLNYWTWWLTVVIPNSWSAHP